VDADHIAAIDNVTRKLMQDGQRPVGVGVFFSLGHSTIVLVISFLLALSIKVVRDNINSGNLADNIGIIGTTVSALFLLLIATINILVLIDIYKMWRQVSRGGSYEEQKVEDYLQNRGLLARLFRPVIRQVDASWKMYPVGVLFGLGFDTATEVGLLGIVATSGSTHLPVFYIMVFPLLFLAGMTVIDTTDSIMMLGAYGWAFVKPIRKLYYNLNITLISVLVALVIGALEALQVVGQELNLSGSFWDFVANDIDLNKMGFVIVAIFALAWIISTAIYRWKDFDNMEVVRA
jgi:high-affinity nickel-transport protein